MKRILLVPLDERPCNYEYQTRLAEGTDLDIILPPRDILARKKEPGDPDAVFRWMEENAEGCAGAVVSIDTLVYSSILASRLHHDGLETLKTRLLRLRAFKEAHPKMPLFAFTLIMRHF